MTIRNAANFCPTCQEVCWHHPTHCTVCGTELEAASPPSNDSNNSSSNNNDNTSTNHRASRNGGDIVGLSPIPDALREETLLASREMRQMLETVRQQIREAGQAQQELLAQVQSLRQQWQDIPAALLDPQFGNANNNGSRPTSKKFLDELPRVVLQEHSPLLYQATLQIDGLPEMEGLLGDFDQPIRTLDQSGKLVIAQPRTGLGGLSRDTKSLVYDGKDNAKTSTMLCFERGDGVTFVQKAFMAQNLGAVACIIANHVAEPWPYVMKDSKKEASNNGGLRIPTVMIKKSDAEHIWNLDHKATTHYSARLAISQPVRDCVVCTDALASGTTVMRLPPCGHVFHQDCVLQWLHKHNTCPFCRRELPTDDEEYEQERRRAQRTHAGSSGNANNSRGHSEFYG